MKERPILFSGPMVRALLAGTKTQTRRVVTPQPVRFAESGWSLPGLCCTSEKGFLHSAPIFKCPYGQPGDRLWVRESFCPIYPQDPHYNGGRPIEYDYAATYKHGDRLGDLIGVKKRWKPSIHMPRAASRIALEITGMRVERLQDISEADAKAEGCDRLDDDEPGYVHREKPDWNLCQRCGGTRLYTAFSGNGGALPDTDCKDCDTYQKRYRLLWDQINGPGSWVANPWVWVVEFRLVKPGEVNQQGVQRS